MRTREEVQSFFEREIRPHLAPLEAKRRKAKRKTVLYHILFACIELAVIGCAAYVLQQILREPWQKGAEIGLFAFGITFLAISGGVAAAWRKKVRTVIGFQREFKNVVIGPLIRFIEPELSYTPERKVVPGALFLGSEMFPHVSYYPKGYWAEDFISGRIGRTNFEFFEIDGDHSYRHGDLYYQEYLYRGVIPVTEVPGDSLLEPISFRGLFFVADFNKSFKGSTLIRTEDRGVRSRWVRATGRDLVRLEDPEFERHFAVYSTDQITARYILSPGLMKRISDFRGRSGRDVRISFRYNRIFIAMSQKKNSFEADVNRSLYDLENIRAYYEDMRLAIDLVEDLNLNTRIWLREAAADGPITPEVPNYSLKKLWVYRTIGPLGGFLNLPGAHNFYIGRYARGLLQFGIANGAMLLGCLHTTFPRTFSDMQPWISLALAAVYAWILMDLITARTDANGDLLSRESPFWSRIFGQATS